MNTFNKQEMEAALEVCASEPIHEIGYIQPHGAMLVFSADARHIVLQNSENLADFMDLPAEGARGKSLFELLGASSLQQIESLIQHAKNKNTAAGKIRLTLNQTEQEIPAHVYRSDELWVLELAHDEGFHQEEHLAELLLQFKQALITSETDNNAAEYFDEIAKFIRALTGYDSVMVYRFDSNWDGEVIAQARAENATSYLGMHFPASDIPVQARRLYSQNLVRVIADIDAARVPVLPAINPATQRPLDMTFSALRCLSPIHLVYLRNKGVKASLVISVLQNGRLWGMISCHHLTPKRASITMREAAIFISRMISSKLSAFEAIEQRNKTTQSNIMVNEVIQLFSSGAHDANWQQLLPILTLPLNASGIIMLVEGKTYLHGQVPDGAAIDELLNWLRSKHTRQTYSTNYLSHEFPPAAAYADIAAGVLSTFISSDFLNCIIWLRQEKPRTINWAGNYAEGLIKNAAGDYRLTPRKSFALWKESWRGRSAPWTSIEIGTASMLALTLPQSLTQQNKIQQEQAKRKQAEAEIHSMAFYDMLTKLPNRRLLNDRLTQAIAASKRSGNHVGVLFLDLDNFKPLNDTHGHVVGDLLLIEVATRLKNCIREIDTAARFGGDEFVVILNELNTDKAASLAEAQSVAEKIRSELAEVYVLNVQAEGSADTTVEHHCSASIGALVFCNQEIKLTDILKYADKAMYQAKQAGRNSIQFYEC